MTRAQARRLSELLEAARIPHALAVHYPARGAGDYRLRLEAGAPLQPELLRALLQAAERERLSLLVRAAELDLL